jgi:predicted unusual protein kinase regulating ubiquinone biosynthesis (AarF/ABC1/UbiB family)
VQLPAKLSRYAAVAALFLKHRSGLTGGEGDAQDAESLTRDLEGLGPTFIKLGQMLSTRSDLLPLPYTTALSRLQDSVEPFSFADVERIVEAELHVRISKAFGEFESTPLATASLGQVHRAALRDGLFVAVKVQRPGVDEQVPKDLEILAEIATAVDNHAAAGPQFAFAEMIEEFGRAMLAELDYRNEASNLRTLGSQLKSFDAIVVPRPIDDYTTARVLTMDYVAGTKVTALSPLTRLDVDGERLGRELLRAYLHQIVIEGFFHADPHPGNVFLTDDHRIALIDLGMVGHLSSRMQDRLLQLLMASAEGRGDETADLLIEIGARLETFDEPALRKEIGDLVAKYRHAVLSDVQVGRVLLESSAMAGRHGLRAPSELTMLGKTLLNLDETARALAPNLDVNATIRDEAVSLVRQRMLRSMSPANVLSTMMEAKHFAEQLPGRVNRVIDSLSRNELKLKVEMIDEGAVMEGLQKVANRITLGLVLAALIIAAAMMMQVPTNFRLFGYPAIAMILFIAAATGGALLAVKIVTTDKAS